jgi:hypothetical protein
VGVEFGTRNWASAPHHKHCDVDCDVTPRDFGTIHQLRRNAHQYSSVRSVRANTSEAPVNKGACWYCRSSVNSHEQRAVTIHTQEVRGSSPCAPTNYPELKGFRGSPWCLACLKQSARANKPERPVSEAFRLGKEIAIRAAQRIRAELGDRLSRDQFIRLSKAFRSAVVPRRKPGRQPSTLVSAAYADWKAGMKPRALCEKHIPAWATHNHYRRNGEQKALMDAIRSRYRRERNTPILP